MEDLRTELEEVVTANRHGTDEKVKEEVNSGSKETQAGGEARCYEEFQEKMQEEEASMLAGDWGRAARVEEAKGRGQEDEKGEAAPVAEI